MRRQRLYLIIYIVVSVLTVGCTGSSGEKPGNGHVPNPADTLYTQQAAMNIYGYQPIRALQIIDSAVIVGNLSEMQAEICRARILSSTLMKEHIDSMLGGRTFIALDSAQHIGERMLRHDSVKSNLKRQKEVLEILANTARMKNDTTGWLKRSREYIDICRQLGVDSETDALRTEAEIGTAMHCLGDHKQGMAKLDSAINKLDATFHRENNRGTFDEMDALIIALKRKILLLASHGQYAETLPLARRIQEQLDQYERHPNDFHDGSPREPKDAQKRTDYIHFYRNQALNYITSAYAALGENGNMLTAFQKIEQGVREATAREHIARYDALQKQIEAERQEVKSRRAYTIAYSSGFFALLVITFAIILAIKNRAINRKNRILAQQISEAMNYKKMFWEEKRTQAKAVEPSQEKEFTDDQFFQYISDIIVSERLFLDPKFGRQTIMDRFQLSKERVGAIFSKGSEFSKVNSYVLKLRLDYATKLLLEQPDKSVVQIATECGFSSSTYFSDRFRQHFGLSPSDFRREASSNFQQQTDHFV